MAKIDYIEGIPQGEKVERGLAASKAVGGNYFAYTGLTEGEAKLSLLARQARLLAAAYPEQRDYQRAADLLANTLYNGVQQYAAVGALHTPLLQAVAYEITAARKAYKPAAGNIYALRNTAHGIGASEWQNVDCEDYATAKTNKDLGLRFRTWQYRVMPFGGNKGAWNANRADCIVRKEVEAILNASIGNSAHHVLYKSMRPDFAPVKGTSVDVKRILHIAGTEALANAGFLSASLMDTWVETAILEKNAQSGVGAVGSVRSGLYLAPDPEQYQNLYFGSAPKQLARIGEPVTLAAITALVTAIGGAIAAAAQMAANLNQKRNNAMNAAQGFGTNAYKAEKGDFLTAKGAGPTGGGVDTKTLLIGGGVLAALYFSTK